MLFRSVYILLCKRYAELKLLEKYGLISQLMLKVEFELIPSQLGEIRKERSIKFVADFVYHDLTKVSTPMIIEVVKSIKTPAYIIKRKLMKFNGYEVTEL